MPDRATKLWSLLRPASVAVVGASDRAGSMAAAPIANLARHRYPGRIYPVSRTRVEVSGLRAYPSVLDLPEVPDTAVLVVPASGVVESLVQCETLGIPTATIVAAGFNEGAAGDHGQSLHGPLQEFLSTAKIRILGPNTAGLFNVTDRYIPRAAVNHPDALIPGDTAIVTQSGGLGNLTVCRATLAGLGVSYAVATGNELDITAWDIIAELLQSDHVARIIVACEAPVSRDDLRRCADLAISRGKPLISVGLGRSQQGGALAATHSGALSANSDAQIAAMFDLGIACVSTVDGAIDVALLTDRWRLGGGAWAGGFSAHRLGLLSTTGGDAILATDLASDAGLTLPELGEGSSATLDDRFSFARIANPLDLTAEVLEKPELVALSLRAFARDPRVDATAFLSGLGGSQYAARLYTALLPELTSIDQDGGRIALIARRLGTETPEVVRLLEAMPCPVFETPERAIAALAQLDQIGRAFALLCPSPDAEPRPADSEPAAGEAVPVGAAPDHRAGAQATRVLPYWQAREIFGGELGLPFPAGLVVKDAGSAALDSIRYEPPARWVVKASCERVVHKTAMGFVRLNLETRAEVAATVSEYLAALWPGGNVPDGEGAVVERQEPVAREFFLGGYRDPLLGPMLVFGAGGSLVEVLRETAIAACPLNPVATCRILDSTLAGRILNTIPGARVEVERVLLATADWFDRAGWVSSFDVNPLAVLADGSLRCLDARIETIDQAVGDAGTNRLSADNA